eukprot:15438813-Alexandrium_andersonii.AAC.1
MCAAICNPPIRNPAIRNPANHHSLARIRTVNVSVLPREPLTCSFAEPLRPRSRAARSGATGVSNT